MTGLWVQFGKSPSSIIQTTEFYACLCRICYFLKLIDNWFWCWVELLEVFEKNGGVPLLVFTRTTHHTR